MRVDRAHVPVAERNTRKKVCMLAYTGYETDNRVRRYAETLVKRGDHVDAIAYVGGRKPTGVEEVAGVTVYRVQQRASHERSKLTYAWRMVRFLVVSSFELIRLHRRHRYDVIHVHNPPDFLVFAAWYPRLTGAKIILDIHDIMPEMYVSKFETSRESLFVKFLKWVERRSIAYSDHVIVSNHLWRDKLIARSVEKDKCSVCINHVDPAIFYRRARTRDDGRFVMVFPGAWQWHQGLDIAIEALGHIKDRAPHAELHLYGGGGGAGMHERLAEQAKRLGLDGRVKFCGGLPLDSIPEVIANADLGVVPKRADSFGNEAYSTKIMEFMSQGTPTVVSRTKIDSYYFKDTDVQFFASGDSKAMAEAILAVMENQELRETLRANGLEYADRNSWSHKKAEYLELVDTLSAEVFDARRNTTADERIGK